jgi:hypothetical protein
VRWNGEASMRKIGSFLNTSSCTCKLNTPPAHVLESARNHVNCYEGTRLVVEAVNIVDIVLIS